MRILRLFQLAFRDFWKPISSKKKNVINNVLNYDIILHKWDIPCGQFLVIKY